MTFKTYAWQKLVAGRATQRQFLAVLFGLTIGTTFPGCVSTRAEQRISSGMTGAQVVRAMGEPYSKVRSKKKGVAVEMWLFRDVQNKSDGRKSIVDTAVTLHDGRVVEVGALKETPAEEAAVSPGTVLGGR